MKSPATIKKTFKNPQTASNTKGNAMRRIITKPTEAKYLKESARLKPLRDKFAKHEALKTIWQKKFQRAYARWQKHHAKTEYYQKQINKELLG